MKRRVVAVRVKMLIKVGAVPPTGSVSQPPDPNGQFDRILRPVVTCLRLLGLPVDHSGIESKILKYWSLSFGLISIIAHLVINVLVMRMLMRQVNLQMMNTNDWNSLISEANFTFALSAAHAALLLWTVPNLKVVVLKLRQIEQLHIFGAEDCDKFRRNFKVGSLGFVVLVCFAYSVVITFLYQSVRIVFLVVN